MTAPRILLLGGLDPSGGAGLTTDACVAHALGVHPMPVATCLTVQNRHGFVSSHATSEELLCASIRAVFDDGPVHAVKLGLVAGGSQLATVLDACATAIPDVPVVVDPVLSATSGGMATPDELVSAYREQMPRIHVLTPNLPELERLAPDGVADLLELGCPHVFLTGGHAPVADDAIEDRLFTAEGVVVVRHPRIDIGPVHGTGCALATALASRLARGEAVESACRSAVDDLIASLERTPNSTDGLPVPLVVSASRNSE